MFSNFFKFEGKFLNYGFMGTQGIAHPQKEITLFDKMRNVSIISVSSAGKAAVRQFISYLNGSFL